MLNVNRLVFISSIFHLVASNIPEEIFFHPLECNAALANLDKCESWKETFGDSSTQAKEISIPCGKCINLDISERSLALTGGLNVIGKLVISTAVDIETPFVIVQGELQLNSNKIWDGTQAITITLTGTSPKTFQPADSNASKCRGQPCSIGKKPFVVAGGKLLVDGMPSSDYDTPTWVHIQDVLANTAGSGASVAPIEVYPGVVDLPLCSEDGKIIHEDFSTPSKPTTSFYHVDSSLGSNFEYTESSLKVSARRDVSHGPIFDLLDVIRCIKPNVRYELNARVKTYRDDTGPNEIQESNCSSDGSGCLDIMFEWKRMNGSTGREYPYHEEESYKWRYGDEIIISETIVFSEEMLEPSNIYSIFHLYGPDPGVTIEVYEFQFKLAPEAAYRKPGDVCGDLALPNGDAEMDPLSSFPYKADAYYSNVFVTQDEDNLSNHYFRISGRGNSHHGGLRWNTGIGCMSTNSVYRVKVDYRLHPNQERPNPETYGFRVRLKVKRETDRDNWFEIARCGNPEDESSTWQSCDKQFTVPEGLVNHGDLEYEIIFETERFIDYDVDNISIVQLSGPVNAIKVDDSVNGKWGVGAELLITSHTNRWDEEQVRSITKIEPSNEAGYVNIVLNETIKAPTTLKDDNRYATEVAVLSRNIKVQGAEDDPDPLHGGHIMIFLTPGGGQSVVGLEVTNMGQAGELGRYPLHFHVCGDVTGSRLSKNLIRGTNQRCAVVHGTDNLLVDNNVAYDTFGHCFMVEDGFERFNTFSNNLGARTKRATQIIPNQPTKNNGDETDRSAATFWITNPMNYFENNVAAGGEFSGFWFELRNRPRGKLSHLYEGKEWSLRQMSLGMFKGNVAHSYDSAGIRTYPHGYVPDNVAVFENSRSYRNDASGMFIHNSRNITLTGFHFADNEQGVDLDRIDLFEMHNSEIVGRSTDYRDKVLSQKAPNVCGGNPTYVRGVEMHTFRAARGLESTLQGKFNNVKFSGFNDTGCSDSAVFWADDEVRVQSWDYWTSLENSEVEGSFEGYIANFCRAVNVGILDSYIIDKDSAFGNAFGSSVEGPSTIMTYTNTNKKMQSFVEPTLCHDYPESCYSYCENTCLRTVTFRVDPAWSDKNKLKICKKNDPQNRCEVFNSWYNADTGDRFRIFSPALPAGSYVAEFIDELDQTVWPRGLNVTYETDMCNQGGLSEGDVEWTVPKIDPNNCKNLIANGDAEASDTDPISWVFERNMGIEIINLAGIDGSNAFGDIKTESHDDGLTQHLDTRCLSHNIGRQYEVKAYVKLIDNNGKAVYCDPSVKGSWHCPRIMLHYGMHRRDNERFLRDREIEIGVTRSRHTNNEGYQLVNGIVTISESLADSTNVRLYVERRSNSLEMFVDDVSMTLLSESSCDDEDDELVSNGGFDNGSSELWNDYDAEGLQIVSPGTGGTGYALKMTTGSAEHSIKNNCIVAGNRYIAQAKYRLLDRGGNPTSCDPQTNNPRCPEMSLRLFDESNNYLGYVGGIARALDSTSDTADNFSTLWGVFEATDLIESAADVRIFFQRTGSNMILDSVSVKEIGTASEALMGKTLTSSQGELIVNGDNELGVANFWTGSGVSQDKISTVNGFGGTGVAVRVTGRNHYHRGMWYSGEKYVDKENRLIPSSRWKISAQIRLLEPGTDNGAECDISERTDASKRCPRFRVRFYDKSDRYTPVREEIIYSYIGTWNTNGWNRFEGQVEVPSTSTYTIDKIVILVSDARKNVDIAVDNLSMVPFP